MSHLATLREVCERENLLIDSWCLNPGFGPHRITIEANGKNPFASVLTDESLDRCVERQAQCIVEDWLGFDWHGWCDGCAGTTQVSPTHWPERGGHSTCEACFNGDCNDGFGS